MKGLREIASLSLFLAAKADVLVAPGAHLFCWPVGHETQRFVELCSSLLTLGRVEASFTLLSLNRSLRQKFGEVGIRAPGGDGLRLKSLQLTVNGWAEQPS